MSCLRRFSRINLSSSSRASYTSYPTRIRSTNHNLISRPSNHARSYASEGVVTPQMPPAKSNRLMTAILGFTVLSATYGLGVLYPPDLYTLIYPREAPPSPSDGSPEALLHAKKLEADLWSIPLVQKLAAASYPLNTDVVPPQYRGPPEIANLNSDVNLSGENGTAAKAATLTHYMTRPYTGVPEPLRRHSLTANLLQGPGRMAVPPLMFVRLDEKATTSVIHVGRSICGHDGIVHGGAIATLFDDGLFRTAVASFPAKIGVTAWIKVSYVAPTRADQFVVFQGKVDKAEGRKVFVSGTLEDLDGNVLVTAEALFVQPKYAHLLDSEQIEKAYLSKPAAITRTLEPVAESSNMK